ncbi:hypothetical protein LS68_000730 [Helicobacter sp. MIT 05-5293]|uniref:hypothetical protein n=1 Tax=Helicobacter sp. MIT 05-5293 TaxID=1548149 RepID=UPI00051D2E7B|nr:hypothetical protein [Helicobacter sp. MIT 05-5293]TLD81591.1 hypothetical protein LS68_000730 [Helicobacter sp. MIT 05-5293]
MNLIDIHKEGDTKEIKFCGLTIYKRIVCGIYKKSYFCGINVLSQNILKGFYKKHKKSFKDYTTIYLLNSNIGEAFLVFKYFANHLHSDSTLFVATKKFHIEIINMLLPKCNYILRPINPDGYPDTFEVDKKTFRVLFNHQYYIGLEKDIKNAESLAPPPLFSKNV